MNIHWSFFKAAKVIQSKEVCNILFFFCCFIKINSIAAGILGCCHYKTECTGSIYWCTVPTVFILNWLCLSKYSPGGAFWVNFLKGFWNFDEHWFVVRFCTIRSEIKRRILPCCIYLNKHKNKNRWHIRGIDTHLCLWKQDFNLIVQNHIFKWGSQYVISSSAELIPALDYVPQNRMCTGPAQRVDLHFSAALCYKHYLSNPPPFSSLLSSVPPPASLSLSFLLCVWMWGRWPSKRSLTQFLLLMFNVL